MKKTINILLILGFSTGLMAWSNQDYKRFNYKTFSHLENVNKSFNSSEQDWRLLDAACFYETNRQRVKHGRKPFLYTSILEKSANDHSWDMLRKNYFSHTGRISGKKTMSQRIASAGIEGGYRAENIAYFEEYQQLSYLQIAKKLLSQWMHSPGHRKNILSRNYNYLGCGISYKIGKENYKKIYATQNFSSKNGYVTYYSNYSDIKRKNPIILQKPDGGFSQNIRGVWDCGEFGIMKLGYKNNKYKGSYTFNNGFIEGSINKRGQYAGTWRQKQNSKAGNFYFNLSIERLSNRPTHMRGYWNYTGDKKWRGKWKCVRK